MVFLVRLVSSLRWFFQPKVYTHTKIHKGNFAEIFFSLSRLNERNRKEHEKEEVCNKGSWFCKFFISFFWVDLHQRRFYLTEARDYNSSFNHERMFLPLFLLLMMHFKYFWHGKLKKICHSCIRVYVLRAHARVAAISHLKTVIKVKKNSIFSSHLYAEIRFSLSFISFLACAMCCYHIWYDLFA